MERDNYRFFNTADLKKTNGIERRANEKFIRAELEKLFHSTITDYDRFGHMLLNGGELDGVRILKPETVELMHTEAAETHLEPEPGFVWGLGMKIRQDPSKSDCKATAGTYGWSGAFGTHFFISPADNLECVFMTNRSDLNGSGSYISAKVEEMVFNIWGKQV